METADYKLQAAEPHDAFYQLERNVSIVTPFFWLIEICRKKKQFNDKRQFTLGIMFFLITYNLRVLFGSLH